VRNEELRDFNPNERLTDSNNEVWGFTLINDLSIEL
jgi:hypothetical protein